MRLYCYVCGEDIEERFQLLQLIDTDRPFVIHEKCAGRVDKEMEAVLINVRRERNT